MHATLAYHRLSFLTMYSMCFSLLPQTRDGCYIHTRTAYETTKRLTAAATAAAGDIFLFILKRHANKNKANNR